MHDKNEGRVSSEIQLFLWQQYKQMDDEYSGKMYSNCAIKTSTSSELVKGLKFH